MDNRQKRPLHWAADYARGNTAILEQLLVECGALVNVQDEEGATPLHLAVYRVCSVHWATPADFVNALLPWHRQRTTVGDAVSGTLLNPAHLPGGPLPDHPGCRGTSRPPSFC